ncbi:flagellar basal body protein [Nocardioides convexus]|uniref:flagellar basal body protein n=1 Tax=Nocardioides convexus TaxID=2712224 RepID=UPI00241891DC|nr:flagellar basal body protein [Nocardioides convexus]
MVLASGRTRWLVNATREVESVLEDIRATEVLRATAADEAAEALGLTPNPSLGALAESAPDPWRGILLDHRDAMVALAREIAETSEDAKGLITAGYRSARETLLALGSTTTASLHPVRRRRRRAGRAAPGRPEPVMAGSFGGISAASAALRFQQVALDVAGSNISNASTDGYVRRRVVGETISTNVPAVWSRSDRLRRHRRHRRGAPDGRPPARHPGTPRARHALGPADHPDDPLPGRGGHRRAGQERRLRRPARLPQRLAGPLDQPRR